MPPDNEERRPQEGAAPKSTATTTSHILQPAVEIVAYVDHFRHRVIADALAEATSTYWLKRADDFEWARPSLADFPGDVTLDQRRMRWRELTKVATACRNRATVSLMQDGNDIEIVAALREAS